MYTNTGQSNSQIHSSNSLNADQAKAAMGVGTRLQSMLLPQGQGQGQQTAQNADPGLGGPSNQTTPEDTTNQLQGLESRIFDELGTLKDEIKQISNPKDQNAELENLKKEIDSVLASTD